MTLYDSVNDIKEMLFGEKGSGFDEMREGIRREAESERVTMPPQYMMMKITNYCNSDCIYCNHAKSAIMQKAGRRARSKRKYHWNACGRSLTRRSGWG